MNLLDFPNEILVQICLSISDLSTFSAFSLTCVTLNEVGQSCILKQKCRFFTSVIFENVKKDYVCGKNVRILSDCRHHYCIEDIIEGRISYMSKKYRCLYYECSRIKDKTTSIEKFWPLYERNPQNVYMGKKKSSVTKVNDSRAGMKKKYYSIGPLGSLYHWKNGGRHGNQIDFDIDGNVIVIRGWRYGKKHGLDVRWSNGKLVELTEYKENRLHGDFGSWFPNGQRRYTYTFLEGNADGICIEKNERGEVISVKMYHQGRLLGEST